MMADGGFIRPTTGNGFKVNQVCRYYLNNVCYKGSQCNFLHDRSLPPDTVCRFYQRGNCFYGDRCRYDHVRPSQNQGRVVSDMSRTDQQQQESDSGNEEEVDTEEDERSKHLYQQQGARPKVKQTRRSNRTQNRSRSPSSDENSSGAERERERRRSQRACRGRENNPELELPCKQKKNLKRESKGFRDSTEQKPQKDRRKEKIQESRRLNEEQRWTDGQKSQGEKQNNWNQESRGKNEEPGGGTEKISPREGRKNLDQASPRLSDGQDLVRSLTWQPHGQKEVGSANGDQVVEQGEWKNSSTKPRSNSQDDRKSKMVVLKKGQAPEEIDSARRKREEFERKWVQAKDFVPGQKRYGCGPESYAEAVQEGAGYTADQLSSIVCPLEAADEVCYVDGCIYKHSNTYSHEYSHEEHPLTCDCKECLDMHEQEMKLAFAVQATQDKECNICLEVVVQKDTTKSPTARKFGILENCSHVFCLDCIRQWRSNKSPDIETQKACPACRVHSDFVTPSRHWVEEPEEKKEVIQKYREFLSKKNCQYFKEGTGFCPFDSKCFYKHALPSGEVVTKNVIERRRRKNADGDNSIMEESILWDFVAHRDEGDSIQLENQLALALFGLLMESDFESSDSEVEVSLSVR